MSRLWITKQNVSVQGTPDGQTWVLSDLDTLEDFPFENWESALWCADHYEEVNLMPMPLTVRLQRVADA